MRYASFLVLLASLAFGGTVRAQNVDMAAATPARYLETPVGQKPRVVITADPELDDSNSLIRYLLYSADVRTEGLIYASSQYHWKGDGKGTRFMRPGREYTWFGLNLCPCTSYRWAPGERFIDAALDAYAAAYPNLRVHDAGYPAPATLRSKVRVGNVDFEGEIDHDTPGSDLIRKLLLDDEATPVYLHAWGGQSTIARALKSIEDQYAGKPDWPTMRARVIAKAVIHSSGDQDDSYARYIKPHWPEIRYRELAGGVELGYNAQNLSSPADATYFSAAWTGANVSSLGALGALYRVWGDGRKMVPGDRFDYFGLAGLSAVELKRQGYVVFVPPQPKGAFLGEGDSPTFLNLINNGLLGYRDDSLGGWGGYPRSGAPVMDPAAMQATMDFLQHPDHSVSFPRKPTNPFFAAVQNDFAARLLWATVPAYSKANHAPRLVLQGDRLATVRRGRTVMLRVKTSDPDGDAVKVRWWQWRAAGSYPGAVTIDGAATASAHVRVPADAVPADKIVLIAEATDDGTPALTRYAKRILTVAP